MVYSVQYQNIIDLNWIVLQLNASAKPRNMLCKQNVCFFLFRRLFIIQFFFSVVVDSSDPVTLHIVFASLSNWREGQRNTHTATQRHPTSLSSHPPPPATPTGNGESTAATEPQGEDDGSCREQSPEREFVISGSLIVEAYSWRAIQSGKFVLRFTTTGAKGTVLRLPPG